ncbi:MAG: peroxiredoxin, partial [Methylosarcina sp.]
RGIERSTFLFDTQGNLVREWRKVTVKTHIAEVLQALSALACKE